MDRAGHDPQSRQSLEERSNWLPATSVQSNRPLLAERRTAVNPATGQRDMVAPAVKVTGIVGAIALGDAATFHEISRLDR
jgi:hypothetical protein